MPVMSVLLNLLWIVCGGVWMAVGWVVAVAGAGAGWLVWRRMRKLTEAAG